MILALEKLTSEEQFDQVLKNNQKLFLLKNSTTCNVSADAFAAYSELANELKDVTLYYLNVQEARPLSNAIADRFQVKHESPQALLFTDGELKWHASHWKLTYNELKKQWEA